MLAYSKQSTLVTVSVIIRTFSLWNIYMLIILNKWKTSGQSYKRSTIINYVFGKSQTYYKIANL